MSAQRKRDEPEAAPSLIESIDRRLLLSPIDFLFAEHYRQRVVLNHLDWLAREGRAPAWNKVAKAVLAYVEQDLPYHVADEEQDLFPIMRRRCIAADNLDAVLTVLSAEHVGDEELAEVVVSEIKRRLADPAVLAEPNLAAVAHAFAETQRRHLVWENTLVLPLARKRLSEADLRRLGRQMAARRQIPYPKADMGDRALAALKSLLRE